MSENDHGAMIRTFIKANGTAEGALDALDALHELEATATTTAEQIAREREFAEAIYKAQRDARAAVKDAKINVRGGSYSVAETEQLIQIAREALADHGLSITTGGSEARVEGGASFMRFKFGLRHVRGHVDWSEHDWPINLSGGQQAAQNARRGTATSALGYYIRDELLLERKADESEAAQAQPRRSGPNRERAARPASRAAPAQLGPKAQAVVARVQGVQALEDLDRAESYVADLAAAQSDGAGEFTPEEIGAMERAVSERRAAFEGAAA